MAEKKIKIVLKAKELEEIVGLELSCEELEKYTEGIEIKMEGETMKDVITQRKH